MSIRSIAKGRLLPAFIVIFIALVLFVIGLVDRLESPVHNVVTVGAADQPAVDVS